MIATNILASQALAERIIRHVVRYRLIVAEALATVPGVAALDSWGQRKILRELEHSGWLASAALDRHRRCYYLSRAAATRLGLASQRAGSLSELAKIRHYALLAFCCLESVRRQRLAAAEIQQHFPDLYRAGMPGSYYVDLTPGVRRLGLARVDAGGHGRWDRTLETCREDVTAHRLHPGFRRLLQAGQFEITILTPFERKAERLRDALLGLPDTKRMPVQVVALPHLLSLIAPHSRHAARKEAARP
jgi:hypothetical protein